MITVVVDRERECIDNEINKDLETLTNEDFDVYITAWEEFETMPTYHQYKTQPGMQKILQHRAAMHHVKIYNRPYNVRRRAFEKEYVAKYGTN